MRPLILIPAYNEADSLPAVVAEIRARVPQVDLLVVDDGSEDRTPQVLAERNVQRLRLPVRQGVGTAVRAGLRYARASGYDIVVRLDGDGQHPAELVAPLIEPIVSGAADVAIGSRYAHHPRPKAIPLSRRLLHYGLARVISLLTGRQVTDPTSGLWAFGPRAVAILAEHHPSGYAEPELYLFLHRNRVTTIEVPVETRERMAGQSSLTIARSSAAFLRLLILLAVVPLRGPAARDH